MKTPMLVLLAVSALAADKAATNKPTINDAEKVLFWRASANLQAALSAKLQAQANFEKASETETKAKAELDALIAAKKKEGCELDLSPQQELTCKPQAAATK